MNETYIEFKLGKMYYYDNQNGDETLVFLHGWGQSFATFSIIIEAFKDKFRIFGVDFLGFGKSDEPNMPLSLIDYVDQLHELLEKLEIKNPILIGHSFGGRVAIKYTSLYQVKKLILVSTAGIKNHDLKYYYKVYRYKVLKRVYQIFSKTKYQELITNSGSTDYKNATSIMKQTLSKIVSSSLKKEMKKIGVETYLLWGVHDKVTPYLDGIKIKELILTSKLIPFYQSGHFCYLQESGKFISTLEKIL